MKGRLTRLKELGLIKASEMKAPPSTPADGPEVPAAAGRIFLERDAFLPGWEKIAPHTFTRTIETGLRAADSGGGMFDRGNFEYRQLSLRKSLEKASGTPAAAERFFPLDRLCFFDLETTGLSGGSGTIAFLAAMGFFEGSSFLVTQVFIDDFPGEGSFLDFSLNLLAERPFLVTYNGASFDLPLLRTRCILNAFPLPEFGHIDVLRFTRRLWRRTLGSCSLQAMESAVLGEEREGDVPGFLIPRLWLDYAACAGGEPPGELLAMMERIAEHNARDVISLAKLFMRIDGIMTDPLRRFSSERVYVPHLALELIAAGRVDEGRKILEDAGADGDDVALLFLARLHRRERRMEEYIRIVAALDEGSIEACVEKAKYLEHFRKDSAGALACAERAFAILKAEQALENQDDGGKAGQEAEWRGGAVGRARKKARQMRVEDELKVRLRRLARKIGKSDPDTARP